MVLIQLETCNFQLGIDIGSSTVARGVVSLVLGYLSNLVIEMAFLIQVRPRTFRDFQAFLFIHVTSKIFHHVAKCFFSKVIYELHWHLCTYSSNTNGKEFLCSASFHCVIKKVSQILSHIDNWSLHKSSYSSLNPSFSFYHVILKINWRRSRTTNQKSINRPKWLEHQTASILPLTIDEVAPAVWSLRTLDRHPQFYSSHRAY